MNHDQKLLVVVVSMLNGKGSTGVEIHYNLILDYLNLSKIKAVLITPTDTNYIIRKIPNGIQKTLSLLSKNLAYIWGSIISWYRLYNKIKILVSKNKDKKIIFYTQDIISTFAALKAKNNGQRVVAVSHFNISEANEIVLKGVTKENSILWKLLMHIEKISYLNVDKLIFVSKYMKSVVNNRIKNLNNIDQSVISNFCSIENCNITNAHKGSNDLISIGTLEKRKNQEYLLKVLYECKIMGKIYNLSLVGNGPDFEELKKLAKDLKVNDQIKFLGVVAHAFELLPSFKIYVHSAIIENLSISIIEALGSGLPVIASRVGGTPEIITDGVEGLFWDLDNPKMGAELLINLLEDPDRMKKMSLAAKNSFNNKFSSEVLVTLWMRGILGS